MNLHSHHSNQNYGEIVERFMNTELYYKEPIEYENTWIEYSNDCMTYLNIINTIPDIITKKYINTRVFSN